MENSILEVQAQSRIEQGQTNGEGCRDILKQHPCLSPYEELPEIEKAHDCDTALGTLNGDKYLSLHWYYNPDDVQTVKIVDELPVIKDKE